MFTKIPQRIIDGKGLKYVSRKLCIRALVIYYPPYKLCYSINIVTIALFVSILTINNLALLSYAFQTVFSQFFMMPQLLACQITEVFVL